MNLASLTVNYSSQLARAPKLTGRLVEKQKGGPPMGHGSETWFVQLLDTCPSQIELNNLAYAAHQDGNLES